MRRGVHLLYLLMLSFLSIYAQNDTILLDFGGTLSPSPWNNLTNPINGQINPLLNHKGLSTNYNVELYDTFNGTNYDGTLTPDPTLGILLSGSEDSFYGNMQPFAGQAQPTGGIRFTGLLPNKQYTVQLFASRVATDNRETKYTLTGQTVDSLFLNVASNTSTIVEASLYPAADGTIEIQATAGPNNNNTYGFFYLGIAKLIYDSEPLVGPISLDLLTPDGGEYWQVGKTATIKWQSQNLGQILLEYSKDNGANWMVIDSLLSAQQQYNWLIPNTPSTQCLVRISADTLSDISLSNFEITSDTTTCRIVVLGSSTAAGTGPSSPDSTWVNRYRAAITTADTRLEVINLAIGGYTTYHILPTGTPIVINVNIAVDTTRNITKALSYDPVAIIINMPSNDAANNFDVTQQLDNFDLMFTEAQNVGVKTWICTTQPRNNFSQTQIQIQQEVADSVQAIYGLQSLDFWNGFATAGGSLLPTYDSGDGVHMNDLGHRILFERVLAKEIETQTCEGISLGFEEQKNTPSSIHVYPNPSSGHFYMELEAEVAGVFMIDCFDVLGQLVFQEERSVGVGRQVLRFQIPEEGKTSGVLFLRGVLGNRVFGKALMIVD